MTQPVVSPDKPASVREFPAARAAAQTPAGAQHQVVVHYWRRMKQRRVYPLRVELLPIAGMTPGASPAASVVVRPLVPGAQVVPSEREVTAGMGGQALFHVMPLAKGWLRDARVEVRRNGQVVQTLPLGMKTTSQKLTWFCLAMTVLFPAFILYTTKYCDFSFAGSVRPTSYGKAKAGMQAPPGADDPGVKPLGQPAKPGQPIVAGPVARPQQGGAGVGDPGDAPTAQQYEPQAVRPKGPLADLITQNVPDICFPLEFKSKTEGSGWEVANSLNLTWTFAGGLQSTYDTARALSEDHLSFYLVFPMLGLTAISWITHITLRGRKRGQPMAFGSSQQIDGGGETMQMALPGDLPSVKPAL